MHVVGHVQNYYNVRTNVSRFDQTLLYKQVEKKVRFKLRKDGARLHQKFWAAHHDFHPVTITKVPQNLVHFTLYAVLTFLSLQPTVNARIGKSW